LFDIDAAIEARRLRVWEVRARAQPSAEAEQRRRDQNCQHRRWLALHRGDHWSLERIARLDGVTVAQVYCGIVLALRHEPRQGRLRRTVLMRRFV
jgi:hypothetical protein